MERVSRWLETQTEPRTGRHITDAVSGKQSIVRIAITVLAAEGYIATTPGARGATLHSHIRPFQQDPDS